MKPFARFDTNPDIRKMPLLSVNCDELYPDSLRAAIDYTVEQRANVLDNYLQQNLVYSPKEIIQSELYNVFCERTPEGYKVFNSFQKSCEKYFNERDPKNRRNELKQLLEQAIYQGMISMMNLQSNNKGEVLRKFCDHPAFHQHRNSEAINFTESVRKSTQNALNSEFISPEIKTVLYPKGIEIIVVTGNSLNPYIPGRQHEALATAFDLDRIAILASYLHPVILHEELDHLAIKKVVTKKDLREFRDELESLFSNKDMAAFTMLKKAKNKAIYSASFDFSNPNIVADVMAEVMADIRYLRDVAVLDAKNKDGTLTTAEALVQADVVLQPIFGKLLEFRQEVDLNMKSWAYISEGMRTRNSESAENLAKLMGITISEKGIS